MTSRISPEDWEILSAYLDGQVSVKEQEKLRLKLETEPELQRALEELQRTKMVLRSAPRRRVPHNFTLTPDMLPQRKPWFRLVPTLSFASAMSVILLTLTFAFSRLPGLAGTLSMASQPPVATQAASAPNLTAPRNDQSAGNPPIIVWGGGGLGGGGGGGGLGGGGGAGGADPTIEAQMATQYALDNKGGDTSIAPTPVPGIGGGEPKPTQPPAAPELTPIPPESTPGPSIAPLPTETSQPPAAQFAPSVEGSGPILGIRPTQEMGKIVVEPGTDHFNAAPERSAAQAAPEPFLNQYLMAVQIGLGILALATALAAFFLHRKS